MACTSKLDGVSWPDIFPKENFYLMRNMKPRDNDIILTTIPRCGTHWTFYITYAIVHPEEPPPDADSIYNFCRFVDMMGMHKTKVIAEDEVQMYSTHIPINYLPKYTNYKIIGVVRNPLDRCVSLYKIYQDASKWEISGIVPSCVKDVEEGQGLPDEYFDEYLQGDFFTIAKSLYARRNDPNVHLIVYEKLRANPKEEILRLARFLGRAEKLEANDGKLLDKIVEQTSFGSMKKNIVFTFPREGKEMNVLRKGAIGGYRDWLTEDQIKMLKGKMEVELEGTELLEMWRDV